MRILTAILMTALLSGAAAKEQKKAADENAWKTRVFTAEELKKYDGKDGAPVYAAVDGIVYDLSKSKYWKTGRHMKKHDAGTDLSADMHDKAPKEIHKDGKILEKMPKVGVLAGYGKEKPAAATPAAEEKPASTSLMPTLHKVTKEEIGLETSCPVTGEKITVTEKTPSLEFKGKTYFFSGLPSMEKFSKGMGKQFTGKAKGLFKKKKN